MKLTSTALLCLAALTLEGVSPLARQSQAQITGLLESGTGLDPAGAMVSGVGLAEDVLAFTDRTHQYNGSNTANTIASLGLSGAQYAMIANDNREVGNYQLDVTIDSPVDAYVFMDQRYTAPAWLSANGWTFIGRVLGIDESGDGVGPGAGINQRFWLWKNSFAAGTFSTFERGGTGGNMYGVAVVAPGTGPDVTPFAQGNFGLIDLGASDGRFEPGALADVSGNQQIGAATNGANGANLIAREMLSPLDPDSFFITVDNLDQNGIAVGGIDWRDRGNSRGGDLGVALANVGEDHLKNNAGVIRVLLDDLPAGEYTITSFHVDAENSQSENIAIWVDNGSGFVNTGAVGNSSFPGNANPGADGEHDLETHTMTTLRSATFSFTADGTNSVAIVFDGRGAADLEVPLAGLNIEYVPEPSGIALAVVAGVFGLAFMRRRK